MNRQKLDAQPASRNPVLIVGSARSGTTFLAKLLDSHPDVLYRHEPDSALVNTSLPFIPRREEMPALLEPTRHYLDALCQVRSTKVSGQRPIFDKTYRSSLQRKQFLAGLYLAKAVERFGAGLIRGQLAVGDCINQSWSERILYVIKTVDSPWRTDLFNQAKPTWRFLHILRHPCAIINSRLRGIEKKLMDSTVYLRPPFEAGMAEGFDFSLEELEASSYEEKVAFSWMICNQRIYESMKGRENYRVVIYEDLCQKLEPIARQVFEFSGLSWHLQTEGFIANLLHRDGSDAGYFNVLRSPLTAVDKWRHQLTAEQVTRIERIVCHSEVGRWFFDRASQQQGLTP